MIWSLFATLSDFWDPCRTFQHSNASFTYILLTILCQELTYEVKYIQCQFSNFDFTRAWVLNNALNKCWHRVTHEFNHQLKRRKRKKMIKGVMMMMMMICNTFYQNQSKFCKSKLCTIAEKCDHLWVVMMICNSSYQNQSKFVLQMKNVIIYEVFTLLGMFHMDSHHSIIIYEIHSQSP